MSLPSSLVSVFGDCPQMGHRHTSSFAFPKEYYFPVTKEGETTRQTLEKSPLLILLTMWGQNRNILRVWIV